jgi:ubiquinone/menaquinone biosynthesis C-methylase UbiE
MSDGAAGRRSEQNLTPPTATAFDEGFTQAAASAGLRRVWQASEPDLPAEIEPFSFISVALLDHLVRSLDLAAGATLADLACGRGGPGLWLAKTTGAALIGVDFSRIAVAHATARTELFGLAHRARFTVGDLTATALPDQIADAAVCIDALHFPTDIPAAAREALRILRPGGRLVLTNWQPRTPGDDRLAPRHRITWNPILRDAGFTDITIEARPEWHDTYTRAYRTALDLDNTDNDTALAAFQNEARRQLATAHLVGRIVATAQRPT